MPSLPQTELSGPIFDRHSAGKAEKSPKMTQFWHKPSPRLPTSHARAAGHQMHPRRPLAPPETPVCCVLHYLGPPTAKLHEGCFTPFKYVAFYCNYLSTLFAHHRTPWNLRGSAFNIKGFCPKFGQKCRWPERHFLTRTGRLAL